MKTLMSKLFFVFLFLTPISCLADMLFACHEDHVFAYQFANLNSFPDYEFRFTEPQNDSTLIENGKTYSYTSSHPFPIQFFATNLKSGKVTSNYYFEAGFDKQTVITIEKIENDSIYFKNDFTEIPNSSSSSGNSTIVKLMVFLPLTGLLIYCCLLLFRKQKQPQFK